MLRDNLTGLIEPRFSSAGAYPLALYTDRNESSDDRPPNALKIPARQGGIYALTENGASPLHAEPRHPICFLHAGTHRSGTTYLQSFLQSNEYALASEDLYVPTAGRVSPGGHHNIAWEFTGDTRYDPNQGTLSDLLSELSSVGALRACVSSEDFEYLYRNPSALWTLRSRLNESGYAVKVLFYLRPQAEYAESVYAEAVRHGFSLDFLEFLELFTAVRVTQAPPPREFCLLSLFI